MMSALGNRFRTWRRGRETAPSLSEGFDDTSDTIEPQTFKFNPSEFPDQTFHEWHEVSRRIMSGCVKEIQQHAVNLGNAQLISFRNLAMKVVQQYASHGEYMGEDGDFEMKFSGTGGGSSRPNGDVPLTNMQKEALVKPKARKPSRNSPSKEESPNQIERLLALLKKERIDIQELVKQHQKLEADQVTKIQALARGFVTRKKVKEEKAKVAPKPAPKPAPPPTTPTQGRKAYPKAGSFWEHGDSREGPTNHELTKWRAEIENKKPARPVVFQVKNSDGTFTSYNAKAHLPIIYPKSK